MAERPILILPQPASPIAREKKGGGASGPAPLSAGRQAQRLTPRLDELEKAFEEKRVQVQASAIGFDPEDVIVLETAGSVEDFFKAASKIPGLEFLGEFDEGDIPPDNDFFVQDSAGAKKEYRGRVYMVFANQKAFQQLLRLWDLWQKGEKPERGFAKWRDVFSLLRDIRRWGVRDRLEETGVLDDWRERLKDGEEVLPCEIELWFRTNPALRAVAESRVSQRIRSLGGEVLAPCAIEEIRYHAVAARLPVAAVQALLEGGTDVELVQCEQIQFFRAAGQMVGKLPPSNRESNVREFSLPTPVAGVAPVVALLDGLPLQGHRALAGRLIVDDPDGYESDYRADARRHGTAMASLIIWGDLNADRLSPISQPLYVRPILRPIYPPDWVENAQPTERVEEGILVVDLIHRAIRRLFEGEGSEPPSASSVCVVNLSVGIKDRLFDGTMSPLARLLDWLAWRYRLLFLVSSGNHGHAVDTQIPWSDLATMSPDERCNCIIQAIARDSRNRPLLSPAEAANVLTVAATHADDDSTASPSIHIDPLPKGHPSVVNAQGMGYKRAIKPEILLPGGRVHLQRPILGSETALRIVHAAAGPGHRVASPGPSGDLNRTMKSRGTSNATALASRAAALLFPVLQELRQEDGGTIIDAVPTALWLKTLLVHGARWGDIGAQFRELLKTEGNSAKLSEYLTRLLGYGIVNVDVLRECTETRVTALAGGGIRADQGFEHRFPLPPSLSGRRGWRRLVVTLAWMTPVNPLNHRWRRAHLWFSSPKSQIRVGSNEHLERIESDWQAAQRGTVQHEVFEGERAAVFADGDDIVIHVNCREDAAVLAETVPYALAVTLEVADEIGADIYSEIRSRVLSKIRLGVRGRSAL